ncbi:hypothetical protein PIB30_045013 [Stylosanthes scabra]|uniref:Pentatricopeptide repeat-containing protein n=1 Tax=Stylosanthes scabra TaxID=79078 RepID=A0ABU6ZEU0_9FABA|nr:hypothetical protein [Stylosanthes scabra]
MAKHGVKPDVVTYSSLIDGYCLINEVNKAKCTFEAMTQRGVAPNVQSYSIMINGFCKSKMVDDALNLFAEMRRKNLVPNTVTYSTLIDGLCKSRRISCALELLEKMQDRGQDADMVNGIAYFVTFSVSKWLSYHMCVVEIYCYFLFFSIFVH